MTRAYLRGTIRRAAGIIGIPKTGGTAHKKATGRNIDREVVKGTLDIPPSHAIGTEYGYTATNQSGAADADYTFQPTDAMVFDGNYHDENAKTSKVDAICVRSASTRCWRSAIPPATWDGGLYHQPQRLPQRRVMVMADDEARKYGNAESAEQKRAGYEAQGIDIISMWDEFVTIYGEAVVKADR